jgi:D-tyrosyl-tRNA(Tyr) deacylase
MRNGENIETSNASGIAEATWAPTQAAGRSPEASRGWRSAMRAVIQRVRSASVTVEERIVGQIGVGLVVLLGVVAGDREIDLAYIVDRTAGLRVFPDADGRMNVDLRAASGALLVVSQFTLAGDCRKGRRPSWDAAAPAEEAQGWFERALDAWRALGIHVESGIFRADMQVALVNDGPVTLLLDSRKQF